MYIVIIGWVYVAMMMAVAEATNSTGSVLGALFTFLLYGAAPVVLVIYLMRAPGRRRASKAREAAEWAAQKDANANQLRTTGSVEPDAGGKAPADPVTPVRKES